MKKLLVPIVLLLAVIVGAGAWITSAAEKAVRGQVPAVLSAVTGVPSTLGDVEVELWRGRARLTGISVDNPQGFSSAESMRMEAIEVDIAMTSIPGVLFGGPLRVERLHVDGPVLNLDVDENDRANLAVIAANARPARVPGGPAPGAPDTGGEAGGDASDEAGSTGEADTPREATRVSIADLRISGATFTLNRPGHDAETGTIDAIELADVGGSKGLTPIGLGAVVVSRLVERVLGAAVRAQAEEAVDRAANRLLDKLREKLAE